MADRAVAVGLEVHADVVVVSHVMQELDACREGLGGEGMFNISELK
jgi:hypothetical protein